LEESSAAKNKGMNGRAKWEGPVEGRAMRKLVVSIGIGACIAWSADNGALLGPITGFVVDGRTQNIRAIEGVPGAARLGASASLPFGVAFAAVAARQDYALVVPVNGDGHPLLARGLRGGAPATISIEGAIEPTGMAIAASGSAATLCSISARKLQFLTGLPDAVQALPPIDFSDIVPAVSAVALDSDGSSALLAAEDGGIYFVASRDSSPRLIARLPGVSSIGFLPDGQAAVAGSSRTGDVVLLESLRGAVNIRTVAGPANGIASVRAVQALGARSIGVIAGDGQLASIDLDTAALEWIPLAGEAQSFEPLDRNLYALNRAGAAPLLLLDAAGGRAAWFVPPDRGLAPPVRAGKVK
jgi:hypothetical protein